MEMEMPLNRQLKREEFLNHEVELIVVQVQSYREQPRTSLFAFSWEREGKEEHNTSIPIFPHET